MISGHFSLRGLLYSGVSLILLAMLAGGLSALYLLVKVVDLSDELIKDSLGEMHQVMALQLSVQQFAMPVNDHIIHGGDHERDNYLLGLAVVEERLNGLLTTETLFPGQHQIALQAQNRWFDIKADGEKIMALQDPVGDASAAQMMEVFDRKVDDMVLQLDSLHHLVQDEIGRRHIQMYALQEESVVLLIAAIVLCLLFAIAGGFILRRSFYPAVRALDDAMRHYANGNYNHRVNAKLPDEFQRVTAGFNTMADKLQQVHEQLSYESVHDELTGAYNHRKFITDLDTELARSGRYKHELSVLILDIDHFKHVNDTYGHLAGDFVLQSLVTEVKKALRDIDNLYRYGGEEFCVILSETGEAGARQAAERIRKCVEDTSIVLENDTSVSITVSIGAATCKDCAIESSALVKQADDAVYHVKKNGRNKCYHASDLRQPAVPRQVGS